VASITSKFNVSIPPFSRVLDNLRRSSFDSIGPAINALPDYLKEKKYQDIIDAADCPLQKAHATDLPAFLWVQTRPENFKHFNNFMTVQHMGLNSWLDLYPYQEKVKSLHSPDQPLFVDVGGGLGHQSVAFREAVGDIPNKIVLQDLDPVLAHAIKHPGVEIVPQDFYQPQPEVTKGMSSPWNDFKARFRC
jgi:demethylsterigmatocystin 6-O-methyltransferase